LRAQKLPVRRYLDILAIGLMLALVFGRIGCFLNGCCFGKPTNSCISIRFPYGSLAYNSQIHSDYARGRENPHLDLPADYFGYVNDANQWTDAPEQFKYNYFLKPKELLTTQQKVEVSKDGPYCCLAVYPTQIYESLSALAGCLLLYLHRKKGMRLQKKGGRVPFFFRSGITFGLLFIVYGTMRFLIEFLRDDNPIGANGLTISQNLSIALFILSILLIIVFGKMKQAPCSR
ncbi:MAG: prolipoprotein diacylglyceryl transferase, partial [Phycisphaerae bacterium]|nr:prolipoprotein diacylglyceryl transferase [Phycisphaerae bacterium]